jgi:hypothetical protein
VLLRDSSPAVGHYAGHWVSGVQFRFMLDHPEVRAMFDVLQFWLDRGLYGPHLLEFAFDPELQRIRDLAIPLARRVLVNQCSTHGAVAMRCVRLAGAAPLGRCQVVASVA